MANLDIFSQIAKSVKATVNKKQRPYNAFGALDMNENNHTKLLLALLKYQSDSRYPVLTSFLKAFTKGRGRMIHYERPTDVKIQFNRNYIDGLITFSYNQVNYGVILENKIYDANDGKNQIRNYIKHVLTQLNVNKDYIWVLYLTGDGSKEVNPTSYDLENEDQLTNIGSRFISISYANDIVDWLKTDILNNRTYPESLTAIVRQYVECLEDEFSDKKITDEAGKKMSDCLIKKHHLNNMIGDDVDTLYDFFSQVSELRNSNNVANLDDEDVKLLYETARRTIFNLEERTIGRLEKLTTEILNTRWKKELRKLKIKSWIVRHRGIRSKNKGYIQIALTPDWASAHVEWCNINAATMLTDKEYSIELHMEGNKTIADQWKHHLTPPGSFTAGSREKVRGSSRIFRYKFSLNKPLSKLTDDELKNRLEACYNNDLKFLFESLINNYTAYAPSNAIGNP